MSRTVAVIGGGYGGSAAAKALQAEADVVLVDPRDAFVNAAGSLRALAQPDWAGTMFFPFETLLTRGEVIRDRAVSVDPSGVTLASGRRVEADYLVLATGSDYAYPAKPVSDSVSGGCTPISCAERKPESPSTSSMSCGVGCAWRSAATRSRTPPSSTRSR